MRQPAILGVAAIGAALLLAACGGGGDDNNASAKSNTVLADTNGAALYVSDQEKDGTVRCTGACTSIWIPVAPGDVSRSLASDLGGKLGSVKRPDGSSQATFDGRPVYRFVKDHAQTTMGDGVSDSFGGQQFSWHSVGDAGSSASGSSGSSGGSGGSYSY
jgi:predicted lipoprotein with Yx(FWY)xxD motif